MIKRFVSKITLTSSDSLSTNIEEVVKSYLEKLIVNTCFSGSFITGIHSIIRLGQTVVCNQKLDSTCYVSVEFDANIISFVKGDIVCCSVIKLKDSIIIARGQNIVVMLIDNPDKQIQTNNKIIVITNDIKYSPRQEHISIIAKPFIPTPSIFDNIIYKTTNNKDIDTSFVTERYETLTNIIQEIGDVRKINEILYPYKQIEYDKKNIIDLKSLIESKNSNCLLQINSRIPSNFLQVYKYSIKETKTKCIENNIITVEESYNKIMIIIIEYFIQYYNNIKVFNNIVDDQEYRKSIDFYILTKIA